MRPMTRIHTPIGPSQPCGADHDRRTLLAEALALAALLPVAAMLPCDAHAQANRRPEPGDRLAFEGGDHKGQEIRPDALKVGSEPVLAYPINAQSGQVMESRANLLTVMRLKPDDLKPSSQRNAADGIVVFSSLCTHAGCPVTSLHPSQTQLICDCHGSVFDATDRGTVTNGPATRRLAMLPVELQDGALVVARRFDGPLGPPT